MKKNFIFTVISLTFFCLNAQSNISTQAHNGKVTNILNNEKTNNSTFFSTGEDGFIIRWTDNNLGEHYQLTDKEIRLCASSPTSNEIAIYETDGGLYNRISVWDLNNYTKKYSYSFTDNILSLSYSKKGTYLIIGTSTIGNPVFINTSTGKRISKIKTEAGIYSFIETASSEKTIMLYSLTGTISYYNMQTGKQLRKYSTEQGLTNVILYNKNTLLAGIKDNTVYVINAMSGEVLKKAICKNPRILSGDEVLYYLDIDSKISSIYTIRVTSGGVKGPLIYKNLQMPVKESFSSGTIINDNLFLGSENGNIYSCNVKEETKAQSLTLNLLTTNMYKKVNDIAQVNGNAYFLCENTIIETNMDRSKVSFITLPENMTNLISYKNNLILWSEKKQSNILLCDLKSKEIKSIYKAKSNIQDIKCFNDLLILLESSKSVIMLSLDNGNSNEIYTGSGIQDVVLLDDNLYIAKTSISKPETNLLYVNIKNKETVPLATTGTVSFSLSYDFNTKTIYGISLDRINDKDKTKLFSYNTQTNEFTDIAEVSYVDDNAFTYFSNNKVFSNLGKNQIICINLDRKKQYTLRRSFSMPNKIISIENNLLVLNKNGSISLYDEQIPSPIAELYVDEENNIVEF